MRNTLLEEMGLAGYGTRQWPKGEGMGVRLAFRSQETADEDGTALRRACGRRANGDGPGQQIDYGGQPTSAPRGIPTTFSAQGRGPLHAFVGELSLAIGLTREGDAEATAVRADNVDTYRSCE